MADDFVLRAWNMMERISTCFLITWDGERQRARPMAAVVRPAEHAIFMLSDVARDKAEEIEAWHEVVLAFGDIREQKYVSVNGRAVVSNDRAKIRELWSPFAKAWWDSPDDPGIRVLKVVPDEAELWDSPGTLLTTVTMLAAAASGRRPDVGDNRKIAL
jgi:general stress protein 26